MKSFEEWEREFLKKHRRELVKIARRLEYWKKHDPKKYEEMMRYIRMAEGEVV